MADKDRLDATLLIHLPNGDVQYVKGHHGWNVAIFAPGTTERLATVVFGIDKPLAAFLVRAIIVARQHS